MYKKVEPKLNLPELDKKILAFWEEKDIFKKSVEGRRNCKPFVFFEGPPGLNGMPHIGHCMNRVFKDIVLRYRTMRGFLVERRAGWDTHGLPVELRAEKDLNIKNKQELEVFGMENFINKCKEMLNIYEKEWRQVSRTIGFWVDMDNAYFTYHENYIESVWWSLKEMFDRGLLVKGYRVAPYCARCGTSLAEHEVSQGYEKVTDRTIYVKFEVKNQPNTFFVAWTTTPWTLPSNVALCVNPERDYSTVDVDGTRYILATTLVPKLFEEFKTIKTVKGKELTGTEYLPLWSDVQKLADGKKGWVVTSADFVTLTDGSGIVHIAPAFGEDDYEVGKTFDLPFIQLVDEAGNFKKEMKEYAGIHHRIANDMIIEDLKKRGAVLRETKYEHDYPHCWRCKSPLMYYAREGWFITMSNFRKELTANNNQVKWYPDNIKDGRMGNFLANERDWNLSRDRYWSTPLNIWVCPKCGKKIAVGSKKELQELSGYKGDFELHRPWVDAVTIPCECGEVMSRVPQVIDVWYESGAMPFAQLHYPFENKEIFKKRQVADFIIEGYDQTRGWFHSLQAISTVLFNKTPYKNCVVNGLVLDKNGNKMSKSLGNAVDAGDICHRFGADSFRWFFASNSMPWQNVSFSEDALLEVQRKVISTLWNVYAFFVLYANIDKFQGGKNPLKELKLSTMDKWILSQLNSLIASVTTKMDEYNWTQSAREIEQFVEGLSNWYVRRCRERFWVDGENEDKTAAFETLYTVLVTVAKLMAPIAPFLAEDIFRNLSKEKESVHLCDFPKVSRGFVDAQLEKQMQDVRTIVDLARAARAGTNLKTRQPLARLLVHSVSKFDLTEEELKIIADDINVKAVEFIRDPEKYLSFQLKPQLKTLGPKYGRRLGEIRQFLESCNTSLVVGKLQRGGKVKVAGDIELGLEDVLVYTESKPSFSAASNFGVTVILDTTLTEQLILEGHMREIISKVQNLRKDCGFEVEDRIEVIFEGDSAIAEIIEKTKDEIARVVLADAIIPGSVSAGVESVDINGTSVKFELKKVK